MTTVLGPNSGIKEELERIAKENDGALRPLDVVAAAKKKSSVLHEYFEWDNDHAAELYRLEQARRLIREYRIEVKGGGTTRYWVSVKAPDREYRRAEEVIKQEDLRLQHIDNLRLQLKRLRAELKNFEEFAAVVEAIDAVA